MGPERHLITNKTHPSSLMPSKNSFLLNSHCVAARNFHATTRTLMLAGSKLRSSQNCWIPSIPILFSSWGSERSNTCYLDLSKHRTYILSNIKQNDCHISVVLGRGKHRGPYSRDMQQEFVTTYLCICCRAAPASFGLLRSSWIPWSTDPGFGSSCQWPPLVSSHSEWDSTQQSSLLLAWRTWTVVLCPSAKISAYAEQAQRRSSQSHTWTHGAGQSTVCTNRDKQETHIPTSRYSRGRTIMRHMKDINRN